ncbi:galactoside 2-alpha-L-fucosyltransferase Sec1-like [Physella acuta]|uniref:galactoside 2-alpha-L-fucosyltransferase Sec1-like n=1 Tax=Physella acuta TaxID=109671 RepID=UPI0027DC03E6|nr:galactoside 2-alpha-L-fucosyltransferase Sec1-like [Physella acuta]
MFVYASVLGIARTKNRKPLIDGAGTLQRIFQISYNKNNVHILRWSELRHPNSTIFQNETLQLPQSNITLRGHFRSMTFFYQVEKEIRREFTFQPELQEIAIEFHRNIKSAYPLVTIVGLHVYREKTRRSINTNLNVAPLSYYIKAVKLMSTLISSRAMFIVSSDDPQWCRNNLIIQQEVIFLDAGMPEVHLAILARTTHIIISTGSYGWWAAWLADAVTVYYNRKTQESSDTNYFPSNWIGIGN